MGLLKKVRKVTDEEVIRMSEYISGLCTDKPTPKGVCLMHHSLPMRKDATPASLVGDEKCWDLSVETIRKVKTYLKILQKYARQILSQYDKGIKDFEKFSYRLHHTHHYDNEQNRFPTLLDFHEAMEKAKNDNYPKMVFKGYKPLPPWIIFPHYPGNTIGWRMGLGEQYMNCYNDYYRHLSADDRKVEDMTYPEPAYMQNRAYLELNGGAVGC